MYLPLFDISPYSLREFLAKKNAPLPDNVISIDVKARKPRSITPKRTDDTPKKSVR